MAKELKKPRGLFERPPGSGVWWINYYVKGKQHREKVGRKSDAIALYQKRKADARAGHKLPTLRNSKVLTLSELIEDALEFTKKHKDARNYASKAKIVREALGSQPAEDITPQELTRWLDSRCKSTATFNRYKAFLSLCYREGEHNKKVDVNPARKVRHREEDNGRIRFLSRGEYDRLYQVIAARFPEHLSEFIFSVHSGARLSEQYSMTWRMFHPESRMVRTARAKSNRRVTEGRTIHLNAEALGAIESMRLPGQKPGDSVFPRKGEKGRFDTRSWFQPCLKEAEITDFVWHCNRHTFCSWLAMAGATIKEIQELAGHKTVAMSARYAHLSPAHKLSVVDRISTALARGEEHAPLHAPAILPNLKKTIK